MSDNEGVFRNAKTTVRSICECDHTGDGTNSQHADKTSLISSNELSVGHGECTVKGCDCVQFTWKKFIAD